MENPGSDAPRDQSDLPPCAKFELPLLPNIKMTPADIRRQGSFLYVSLNSVLADGGYNSKIHEYKIKKYSPMLRIGDGYQKYQQCF